jgi:gentisate 1,2-dioxygenase
MSVIERPIEKTESGTWTRWQKKRTFVRELAGKYGEVYRQLLEQPRVYKSKSIPFIQGPILFSKPMINPQDAAIAQAIETHIEVLAPGAAGQKHGHMNSAVFYILSGKGYDVHDRHRHDWRAGDACIVENGCVHQHFNADAKREARILVIKAKPLFLFFHLLFQKNVTLPPTELAPGAEKFRPED